MEPHGTSPKLLQYRKVMMLVRGLAREPSTIQNGWRAEPSPFLSRAYFSPSCCSPPPVLDQGLAHGIRGWMARVVHTVLAAVLQSVTAQLA